MQPPNYSIEGAQITGNLSAAETGSDVIAWANLQKTYLGVARALLPAIKLLSQSAEKGSIALPMLCAHALECGLKSFLSRDGGNEELRKPKVRHNLNTLWQMAAQYGLPIPELPLNWVSRLSELHDRPYHLRYSEGLNGVITPNSEEMTAGLIDVLNTIVRTC